MTAVLSLSDSKATATSLSSDGALAFVGTADGNVHIISARGEDGARRGDDSVIGYTIDAFGDVDGGVTVMPAVVRPPAPDTDPNTIPSKKVSEGGGGSEAPAPASAAASAAPAAAAKAATAPAAGKAVPLAAAGGAGKKSAKGVGFGDLGDDDDGASKRRDSKRGDGKKKKALKPPPPVWPTTASERGWLLACAAAEAPKGGGAVAAAAPGQSATRDHTGLLRVYHVPATISEFSEVRHVINATLPAAVEELQFSLDSRCVELGVLPCASWREGESTVLPVLCVCVCVCECVCV